MTTLYIPGLPFELEGVEMRVLSCIPCRHVCVSFTPAEIGRVTVAGAAGNSGTSHHFVFGAESRDLWEGMCSACMRGESVRATGRPVARQP